MGLDLVELVIATEKHFGIEFDDQDLAEIRTPGQLAGCVAARLAMKGALIRGTCPTQRGFYRLRRVVAKQWGIPSRSLRPNTLLDTVLPTDRRHAHWTGLRDALGVQRRWPVLARPIWLQSLVAALSVVSFGLLILLGSPDAATPDKANVIVVAIVCALMTYVLGIAVTRSKRTRVVPGGYTLGNLAQYLSAYLPAPLATGPSWTMDEVHTQVRAIVSEQLSVSNFTDHSDFVTDLHAD